MATITPRRSLRIPHTHTPKMSERKKGLFQTERSEKGKDSMTKHRLPVVDSESDSDDFDLGIISTLDSSSSDDTVERAAKASDPNTWHQTRSISKRLLMESQDIKDFIKSPFLLKKFQAVRKCRSEPKNRCSMSTPVTPHLQNHPGTPSSTHSCNSYYTTSSEKSKARKSLASLIADTESCSSSLKDLNFDSDTSSDSKENTPRKENVRKSTRLQNMTPKFASFKGILVEQKKNLTSSPAQTGNFKDGNTGFEMMSPTQMLKTPHSTSEAAISPPKIPHSRRVVIDTDESPESGCNNDKTHKRMRNDSLSLSDGGPSAKYPKLETSSGPKARLSLFNSDRLKEILSAKSFYSKPAVDLNSSFTTKIASALIASNNQHRRSYSHHFSHKRRTRRPGQINSGVRHRIKKPKLPKHPGTILRLKGVPPYPIAKTPQPNLYNTPKVSQMTTNADNSDTDDKEKLDPFATEHQTIDALLSQWTEEDIPTTEKALAQTQDIKNIEPLACFNHAVIEETNSIFNPSAPVPVATSEMFVPESGPDIMELGAATRPCKVERKASEDVQMSDLNTQSEVVDTPKSGQFLPVEGGYLLVTENELPAQEVVPDLDEIEKELKMLDDQILLMAQSNNINPDAVLAPSGVATMTRVLEPLVPSPEIELPEEPREQKPERFFSIFTKAASGLSSPSTSKAQAEKSVKRPLLKSVGNQYVIDAGQKNFGAVQCNECGVIYQVGDPQDEHDHLVHHNAVDVLRFNGWKEERVVGEWDSQRCVCVRGAELNWRRVDTLLERVVHPQLGYSGALLHAHQLYLYTAYLFVEKKQIIGCLIVEPKSRAFRLLPGDPDCCSPEDYPVKCGVSRLWTHVSHRRSGVATKLLNCMRASFLYGQPLLSQEVAFSAPTPAGKNFATRYFGTPNFYVYLE